MSGQGKSERARGKDQGELPGSDARERKERRAVQRAFHRDGEVAAARLLLDAAARVARPGAPARGNRRGRRSGATRGGQRDGKRRPGSLSTAPASVPSVGGGENRAGGGGGRKGRFCNFQKFQGLTYKPAITFKPKLKWKSAQHESCSTFQDLQL